LVKALIQQMLYQELERKIFKQKQRFQDKSKLKLKKQREKEQPFKKLEDGKPQLEKITRN